MKNVLQGVTRQTLQMIARTMIVLVVVGFFESSVYSQITSVTGGTRCGAGTVALSATASSGTITWYTVPFYGTPVGTGATFTTPSLPLTTSYFVDAVDGSGCSLDPNQARRTVIATINPNTIVLTIFYSSSTFCNSESTPQQVTQTGPTGGTYSSSPSGLTLDPSTGAITPSTSASGTYTVTYTVTPLPGCTENPATTVVTITTAAVQPVISYSGTPFCTSNATVMPTQTGETGGTYSSTPSGLIINPASGMITPASSLSGTYTITYFVSGGGGCIPMTATTSVTILQLPTAVISYATPFCRNAGSQAVTLTGTGVYTGGTFSAPGGLSIGSSTGAITPASSTPGTYTVSYTLSAEAPCAQVVAQTSVTVYPLPTATLSGTASICSGNSTNLSIALTGTQPWSFTYTDGSLPVHITGQTTSPYSVSVSPTVTTTYSLTAVSDAHCSGTTSGTAVITISTSPNATFEYTDSPYCSNGTNPLPNMLGVGTTGTFSSTEGLVFVSASTGQINLSASTAGTYTVTNTIAASGGCPQVTYTASVTITKLPVATFSYPASYYCANAANPTPTKTEPSTSGHFSSTSGLSFVDATTGQINLAISTPGVYSVTYTIDAAGGCSTVSSSQSVEVKAIPAAVAGFNRGICAGSNTQIGAPQVGSDTYSWSSVPVGFTSALPNPTVSPTVTTIYTVVESNAFCSNSNSVTITMSVAPPANPITGTTPVCAGSNAVSYYVTDHSSSGALYSWQYTGTGATLSSTTLAAITINFANNATSGNLICTETESGCSTINTMAITINPLPTLTSAAQVATVCNGSTATINLTGLLASSTSTVNYTINSVAQTAVTGVIADGSGSASFTSASLTTANNTQTLQITGITVTSASPNCSGTFTVNATLSVDPTSIGGTVASDQTICSGSSPADLTLSGNTGSVVRWESSANSGFSSPTTIAGTSTTLLGTTIGTLTANTYFRAVVKSGTCSEANSTYILVTINPAVHNITQNIYYTTIQSAIDAANSADVIDVAACTFTENVNVNKSVTLTGAGSSLVTVTAAVPTNSVFTVNASNVTISGFTATGTQITGNDGYAGIKFGYGVTGCIIHDNVVSGNQYGILLTEALNNTTPGNNTFTNNTASNCGVSGIEMQNTWTNTFTNNTANFTGDGGQGFRIANSKHNTFTGNTANSTIGTTTNGSCGFFLVVAGGDGSNYNTFTNNTANSNHVHGFRIDGGSGNTLTGNTFNSNGYDGIKLKSSANNNTLTGNTCTLNAIGVEIASSDATTESVTDNDVSGNSSYGISNSGTGTLPATCNWYGSADYNLVWPEVTGAVTFVPYLVTSNITTPVCTGEVPLVHNTTRNLYYNNIQPAIDGATAGDELDVAAGTHIEGPQIIVDRNINLVGADKATTIIKPNENTTNSGDGKAWWLVNQGVIFNLSNVTLDGTNKMIFHGIRHKGTGTIQNVHFTGITYNASGPDYAGFAIYAFGQCGAVNVSNCEFDNIGREGIAYWGAGTTGAYASNTYTGKGLGNWLDYGVEVTNSAVATITGSTITNCRGTATLDGSASAGIIVLLNSQATITGSTLTGNFYGINVGYTGGTETPIAHANNNIISGNYSLGAQHASAYGVFDATNNYWGNASGPYNLASNPCGTGNAVSDNVTFSPWWTTSTGIDGSGTITATPVVTSPIPVGATTVSGTSTEADGTSIDIFVDASSVGTTTVTTNAWTITGLTALTSGQVVTAYATASGKCISLVSNSVTVH